MAVRGELVDVDEPGVGDVVGEDVELGLVDVEPVDVGLGFGDVEGIELGGADVGVELVVVELVVDVGEVVVRDVVGGAVARAGSFDGGGVFVALPAAGAGTWSARVTPNSGPIDASSRSGSLAGTTADAARTLAPLAARCTVTLTSPPAPGAIEINTISSTASTSMIDCLQLALVALHPAAAASSSYVTSVLPAPRSTWRANPSTVLSISLRVAQSTLLSARITTTLCGAA